MEAEAVFGICDKERGIYDTEKALENYQKSLNILEKLNLETVENAEYLHRLATIYERVGNIAAKTGESAVAERNYLAGLKNDTRALQIEPQNETFRRGILLSHFDLGDFYLLQGRYEEALRNLEAVIIMAEENILNDENDTDSKRMIGYADDLSAKAHLALGDEKTGGEKARNSLEIRERLFKADPTNIRLYGDLTVSLDTVGEILTREGKFDEGLKMLKRSLEMREAALKQDSSMTIAKRFAAVSRTKIGEAYRKQNNLDEALNFQRQALKAFLEMTANDPENLELRRELAEVLMNAGITLKQIAVTENSESKQSEARILLKQSAGI